MNKRKYKILIFVILFIGIISGIVIYRSATRDSTRSLKKFIPAEVLNEFQVIAYQSTGLFHGDEQWLLKPKKNNQNAAIHDAVASMTENLAEKDMASNEAGEFAKLNNCPKFSFYDSDRKFLELGVLLDVAYSKEGIIYLSISR